MKKNNIIQVTIEALKNEGRTIQKSLYGVLRIDYNKPYNIYEINGPFTRNQILKTVEPAGYTERTAIIAVLIKNKWCNEYRLATLEPLNTINIDYRPEFFRTEENRLDNYYRKADFDIERKEENAHAFVICQLKDHIAPAKPKVKSYDYKPEPAQRYKLVNNYKTAAGHVYKIDVIETNRTGEKLTINTPYRPAKPAEPITSVIDKSGYLVYFKREKLINAAATLKAEREKAAYTATNHDNELKELYNIIQAKKIELVNALNAAATAAEITAVCERLNRWNGLPDLVASYENLKKNDENKMYSSNKSFMDRYDRIKEKVIAL